MSYLNLPAINMADFSKGTISIWFRLSKDSVTKAVQHSVKYQNKEGAPTILKGTIPLITFGRKVMAHCYRVQMMKDGEYHYPPPFTLVLESWSPHVVELGDQPAPPSHIGIECNRKDNTTGETLPPCLVMFFQMETRADVQGLASQVIEVHWEQPGGGAAQKYETVEDVSYVRTGQPESFLINPIFEVTTDHWHHLVLSFDFTGSIDVIATESQTPQYDDHVPGSSIRSTCKFWYAFDDHNKTGEDLGDAWDHSRSNGVTTQTSFRADFTYFPTDQPFRTGGYTNSEYHWTSSPVPMKGGPVGLPASTEYVDTIYHCEMGELQFFGGLVLDTSDKSKRRAFVDESGDPVDPEDTEKILGRRPDILLHGTSNWQSGENTGSTGSIRMTEGEDQIIPSGQFHPQGRIDPYTPDPSLEESTA
jgi:hypothetical protein